MSVDVSVQSYTPSPTEHASVETRSFFAPAHTHPSHGQSQLQQQYALPIHYASIRDEGVASRPVGPTDQYLRQEMTLRRKTPNGTLNAGYEAATEDVIQPVKHQLIPAAHGKAVLQPSARPAKRTFIQHQRELQRRQHGIFSAVDHPHGEELYPVQHPIGLQSQQQFGVPLHGRSSALPPIHDAHPSIAAQYYGQIIPSVIQPPFQLVGPTAPRIHATGPYGPYYHHDGSFVPYRPAAIRNPQHYSQNLRLSQLDCPTQEHSISAQAFPSPQNWQASAMSPWVTGVPSANIAAHPGHPSLGTSSTPIYDPNAALPPDPLLMPTDIASSSSSQPEPSDVLAEHGPASANAQLINQTFEWALQQYKDLLSSIHHARRQNQQGKSPAGHSPLSTRPTIFPRPPRHGSAATLTGHLQNPPAAQNHSQQLDPNSSQRPPNPIPLGRTEISYGLQSWLSEPDRCVDPQQRRTSYDQYNRSPLYMYRPELNGNMRRASGSLASLLKPSAQVESSPTMRAQTALTQMDTLCKESQWSWIDGMQLSGCLAYGLGQYNQALTWYEKVLAKDSEHLEARSNLAATLLALGQKLDAEKHWMKVVKAAPNHFEAVEHLVGLLCSEQRSREAVKVIQYIERTLRLPSKQDSHQGQSVHASSKLERHGSSESAHQSSEALLNAFDDVNDTVSSFRSRHLRSSSEPGFGTSGFAVPGCDNGRILALVHAKGNMLYGLGENGAAALAFEEAVLIATGRMFESIQALVVHILNIVSAHLRPGSDLTTTSSHDPILLSPEQALATAKLCFPAVGELPGFRYTLGGAHSLARRAMTSTTSNSLLSLAKIFQDGMSNSGRPAGIPPLAHGVRDILALYYLSLSLQPSPSTANNVGILLASVQQSLLPAVSRPPQRFDVPGVVPGSGIALALQYYNYGLQLDQNHAHLYTNLGSLLKDIGQLDAAINMYEHAVKCDGTFDIALANLANAVKDKGRISESIGYYKRAVEASPDFAEAVCGLANALNSVCSWKGRGGIADDHGKRNRWHVEANGMLLDARSSGARSSGWIQRVVEIVERQLVDGESWGLSLLTPDTINDIARQVFVAHDRHSSRTRERERNLRQVLTSWANKRWEGARVTRLIERATRHITWCWYRDLYVDFKSKPRSTYMRPCLPVALTIPTAPTVLPFHTFTCPMSAKQIRLISQRNGLRISVSTMRTSWLPSLVYPPPSPPSQHLRVGYISSDFNNHPLAHLMQSVFGLHDRCRVEAYCYATTAGDNSVHRRQIESEAPMFYDASSWTAERLVRQIVDDGVHILVNLNGYTRGARNEVFAARPAPIQMSFMGFAGTLGAEWCDYLLADETAVPLSTLRPWRRNVDIEDHTHHGDNGDPNEDWVYGENIIYCRDTFFCCDHKQSAPDAHSPRLTWREEQQKRWQMRKELFPQIADNTIIFGNFNQLYKIEPTTFRTWLRILDQVPNSILWLLRFPDLGESHLLATARLWATEEVASRIIFTDVAPKHLHISRARVCDLVLDTAECNAHTTAADVLWSGTPLLTLPRYEYKMCSRMAASILKGACPKNAAGTRAAEELIATSEEDYEAKAVALGRGFKYIPGGEGIANGRLMELRELLFNARWTSALFDTKRWVRDLEDAYEEAWRRWVVGEGGDIFLKDVPVHGTVSDGNGGDS